MSVDKAANPCNKFQANIFNKNKCQNCFKPRELHLMSDDEREQAKPIYGGWLCLAPEGTDFDNPAQRSRKWQRRFFILYENGNLSFALDELMSTLPQGTVDMTSCTAVVDAEPLTGQRNALRLATPQQDLFIRGESREMISGYVGGLGVCVFVCVSAHSAPLGFMLGSCLLQKTQPCGDGSHVSIMQRRAKSLDRRTLDSIKTPDLLNFKKGWMVKLEQDQWRKFWFVLSADSLRYYRDSIAEEAFDLQGEINLTKCYEVSEYQVLKNYGFQIHTRRGVHTLSAMTAGIRKNWIQALMKNVSHAHAPKVGPREQAPQHKDTPKNLQDRRRDDGGKAWDWTEFRPLSESSLELEIRSGEPGSPDTLNQERRKRRQQRRKRYESILGVTQSREKAGDEGVGGRELDPPGGTSGPQQMLVEEEDMEKFWIQVERTTFRVERVVPLFPEAQDWETGKSDILLFAICFKVEDLKCCLEESDCQRMELEAQLRTTGFSHQEKCPMAACESGLSALEVSQQRALEGVRLHHQGELQRLVTEQDRLLEEETSATVTAIESMKRAFQLQLDRQTDKTHQARLSADNTHLQETQRQHSAHVCVCLCVTLSGVHREELEVVVQQFSLQRLENSLLSRALEAERTALCQSGQENRELKERNQELSGLLATELSRLCSRSKQEASPLGQGASVFEQEVIAHSGWRLLTLQLLTFNYLFNCGLRSGVWSFMTVLNTQKHIVRSDFEKNLYYVRGNVRWCNSSSSSSSGSSDNYITVGNRII
uniref:PH domain-containing protein n=1 Tax=Gadus morhua TaxID=8049 RepID=A0A8C4ZQ89_GADMO